MRAGTQNGYSAARYRDRAGRSGSVRKECVNFLMVRFISSFWAKLLDVVAVKDRFIGNSLYQKALHN